MKCTFFKTLPHPRTRLSFGNKFVRELEQGRTYCIESKLLIKAVNPPTLFSRSEPTRNNALYKILLEPQLKEVYV